MKMDAKKMHKMCLRKRKYRDRAFAQKVAKECDEKFGKTHRVYFCPLCGFYHLTTKVIKGDHNESKTN